MEEDKPWCVRGDWIRLDYKVDMNISGEKIHVMCATNAQVQKPLLSIRM